MLVAFALVGAAPDGKLLGEARMTRREAIGMIARILRC
jgi:hypothetical protein